MVWQGGARQRKCPQVLISTESTWLATADDMNLRGWILVKEFAIVDFLISPSLRNRNTVYREKESQPLGIRNGRQ